MYRAPSGALVFGAGTMQWAWGLDNNHSGGSATTSDDAVRQATVNLFADMGVQPATLQSGLSAATASSDTTAPDIDHHSPGRRRYRSGRPAANRQRHSNRCGRRQGRRGRGLDRQRNVMASSDRPRLLVLHVHPRQQRDTDDHDAGYRRQPPHRDTVARPHHHCRTGTPPPPGTARAPSGRAPQPRLLPRIPTPARSRSASSSVPPRPDPSPASGSTRDPAIPEPTSVTCGRLAVRSWRSATFTGESASGWQQVNFGSPVAVAANTTYVASYYAPNGRYATSDGYFATPTTNGPLHGAARWR